MKKQLLLTTLVIVSFLCAQAQKPAPTEKKTFKEKVEEIPDKLIAQPDVVDTNANKIVNNNLSLVVSPVWKDKGELIFNDFKLSKTDVDPLVGTFPIPEKKLPQSVTISINEIKKSATEKKDAVLKDVRSHLAAYFKAAGQPITAAELDVKASALTFGPEKFTTDQGKTGDLYLINDIQAQQTSFIILLVVPGEKPGSLDFIQFQYTRFIYETTFPDDYLDWKFFVYPDDQQLYVDFTKKILKTLVIK